MKNQIQNTRVVKVVESTSSLLQIDNKIVFSYSHSNSYFENKSGKPYKKTKPKFLKNPGHFIKYNLVEAAGVEPASENNLLRLLHTYLKI